MTSECYNHPNRLFPVEPNLRSVARRLYAEVKNLPIVSPHGHTDPVWFADNEPFRNATDLFLIPDHYLFRMLYSQGVSLESLGFSARDGTAVETDRRKIWRTFAEHFHLFQGTPSRIWVDHALSEVFGLEERLSPKNADAQYDRIAECLAKPEFRPRELYDRFNIEVIATTDGALDDLHWHQQARDSDWNGRVVPTYRPDAVIDPEAKGFAGSSPGAARTSALASLPAAGLGD